jgi:hypothetical protein
MKAAISLFWGHIPVVLVFLNIKSASLKFFERPEQRSWTRRQCFSFSKEHKDMDEKMGRFMDKVMEQRGKYVRERSGQMWWYLCYSYAACDASSAVL